MDQSDFQRLLSEGSVTRSQSDTSHEGLASLFKDHRGRRSSEWSAREDKKVVLRPLQLNEDQQCSLLQRRLSRPKEGLSRSYSVRAAKKNAEVRNRGSSIPNDHYGAAKVSERTVSNRSLPLPGDESEYLRLRNFSVTSKGVVNRGDSFRSRSSSIVPREEVQEEPRKKAYKVVLVGASGVGKSSMWKQFMTSEYICADAFAHDRECEKVITVVLNNEESQMEFEVETLQEENVYVSRCEEVDAFVVVYSVIDRRSYSQARRLLSQLERQVDSSKAVILVANKTDLARLRVVTTDEGKCLAKERGCKFIEISVAINHQLDELLVGTLAQIRIKAKAKLRKASLYTGSKASGVLKKILRRACIKSKSCDNLHVL